MLPKFAILLSSYHCKIRLGLLLASRIFMLANFLFPYACCLTLTHCDNWNANVHVICAVIFHNFKWIRTLDTESYSITRVNTTLHCISRTTCTYVRMFPLEASSGQFSGSIPQYSLTKKWYLRLLRGTLNSVLFEREKADACSSRNTVCVPFHDVYWSGGQRSLRHRFSSWKRRDIRKMNVVSNMENVKITW